MYSMDVLKRKNNHNHNHSWPKHYRSKFQIANDILLVIASTKNCHTIDLMYGAKMQYQRLREYLALLAESGLIDWEAHKESYTLTKNGWNYISLFEQIDSLLLQKGEEEKEDE